MNKQRIEELARLLPADATLFAAGCKPGDAAPRLAEQLAIATNNPAFCHRFIMEYVLRKEPLPPAAGTDGRGGSRCQTAELHPTTDFEKQKDICDFLEFCCWDNGGRASRRSGP